MLKNAPIRPRWGKKTAGLFCPPKKIFCKSCVGAKLARVSELGGGVEGWSGVPALTPASYAVRRKRFGQVPNERFAQVPKCTLICGWTEVFCSSAQRVSWSSAQRVFCSSAQRVFLSSAQMYFDLRLDGSVLVKCPTSVLVKCPTSVLVKCPTSV